MNLRLKNRCKRCGAFMPVEEPKPNAGPGIGLFLFHLLCIGIGIALGRYFQ